MLKLEGEIPRRAHVSWKNKDVLASRFPTVLNGIRKLVRLNPDWALEISDDDDVDHYLQDRLSTDDYDRVAHRHIVERVDLWRLLKLYHEGGLYVDLDRNCNVPMRRVLRPGVRCVLATHFDVNFSHDVLLSVPGNPIFATAIELNVSRRRAGETNIYTLGPVTYFDAVCLRLLGKTTPYGDSSHTLVELREIIGRHPDLDTYRETEASTLLCRPDGVPPERGNGQGIAAFYASQNVRHWAGRFD